MKINAQEIIKASNIPYFTRSNLSVVLGTNRRVLDYRIKSLIKSGMLEFVKPGFYINKYLYEREPQKEEFMEYISSVIAFPSYISLEYALAKYNFLAESVFKITCVTAKNPKIFNTNFISFVYKNIKQNLFSDFEEKKYKVNVYYFAPLYKALFDYLYLTPFKSAEDAKSLLFSSRFNWDVLSNDERTKFTRFVVASGSKKMNRVLNYLAKQKIL